MHIINIQSTLVSLTKFDVIPIVKLITNTVLHKEISNRYGFRQSGIEETGGRLNVVFNFGVFERGEEFPIIRLVIEERKIVCVMDAEKEIIDAFYEDVVDFLMQISSVDEPEVFKPIIVSNESEIIAQLDMNISSLFSDQLLNCLENDVVPKLGFGPATARIKPISVKFDVDYVSDDISLQDYRINLVRKELILQLRPGYLQKDRIFVSKMPVDSNTHIQLLTEIEKVYSG